MSPSIRLFAALALSLTVTSVVTIASGKALPAPSPNRWQASAQAEPSVQLGEKQYLSNDVVQAQRTFEQLLQQRRQDHDRRGEAIVLNRLGEIYTSLNQYDRATATLKQALQLWRSLKQPAGEAEALTLLGSLASTTGAYTQATAYLQQALTLQQRLGDRLGLAATQLEQIAVALGQNQPTTALAQAQAGLRNVQAAGQAPEQRFQRRLIQGRLLAWLGQAQMMQDQTAAAMQLLQQALAIQQDLGDRRYEGMTHFFMGLAYAKQTQLEPAVQSYQQAVTIFEPSGDRASLATVQNFIGIAHYQLKQYPAAIAAFQQAIAAYGAVKNTKQQVESWSNLGETYMAQQQYPAAQAAFEQTLTLARKQRIRPAEAQALTRLGKIYKQQANQLSDAGKYAEAVTVGTRSLDYLQQAYRLLPALDSPALQAPIVLEFAMMQIAQGQNWLRVGGSYAQALAAFQQAVPLLNHGQDLLRQLNSEKVASFIPVELSLAYSGQATAYAQLNQWEPAVTATQQAIAVVKQHRDRLDPKLAAQLEGGSLGQLGLYYTNLGNTPKAVEAYQAALAIRHQQADDPDGEVRMLGLLASAYERLSQYPQALSATQQALTLIRTKLNNPSLEGWMLTGLGNYWQGLGNFKAAIQSHEQALAIAKQLDDQDLEFAVLNNLGTAYEEQGHFKQGFIYRQQIVELQEKRLRQVESGDPAKPEPFCLQKLMPEATATGYSRDLCRNHVRSAQATALNNLGVSYGNLGRYAEGLKLRQEALAIAKELGDLGQQATSLGNIGTTYLNLGNYPAALDHLQHALKIWTDTGDRLGQSRTLGNISEVYVAQGQYHKALKSRQQALALIQSLQAPVAQAHLLNLIGSVHGYLGQHQQALAYFQRSLRLLQPLGITPTTQLASIGYIYEIQGDVAKARDAYQQTLTLAQENGDRQKEATALGKLANLDWAEGRYALSLQKRQQAEALYEAMGDRPNQVIELSWLGRSYRILGQTDRAIAFLQQTLTLSREMGARRSEANALYQMGIVYQGNGELAKALDHLRPALAIQREIDDPLSRSKTLTSLGKVLVQQGNPTEAIALLQQALQLQQQLDVPPDQAVTRRELGLAYAAQGKTTQAIATLQQAIAQHRAVADREQESMTLSELGRLLLANHQPAAAEAALTQAIDIFEQLRVGLSDRDNVALFETQGQTYQRLQQALVEQNKPEIALEIAERGRARAFIDLLSQRVSPQPLAHVVAPITLAQIKQMAIDHHATLVEYSVLPDRLYIWVIKPTGEIGFRQTALAPPAPTEQLTAAAPTTAGASPIARGDRATTPDPPAIADLVRQTRSAIQAQTTPSATRAANTASPVLFQARMTGIRSQLDTLHQVLIDPIADLLPSKPDDRVVFIPQGSLFLVPFAALRDRDGKYLIERHTLLTAPSIQVLELTQRQRLQLDRRHPNSQSALIVGAPSPMPDGLATLEGMKLEAIAIAQLLNTQALTGAQASKAQVLAQMPTARLIHLATHGLFDDAQGIGSKVALASTNPQEGYLTADEILNLKLQADLVVLSACNTGRGKVTGDGVIGLSRSLLSAGAPSVVVSLWSVFDESTSVLMAEFYHNLHTRKLDKAQALRQAMLTLMQRYQNPLDWAAFTLIGEP